LANDGTKLYIRTNKNADQYKVVTLDMTAPKPELKDLIPEDKDAHLANVRAVDQDKFVVVYKRNVSHTFD
jgi:prolyl oligopeptidase